MGDRRIFGHDAPDVRAQYVAANKGRRAALWYAYTGEVMRVAAGSTAFALALGYAWLLLLHRRGALAALLSGHDALIGVSALAALCALFRMRTAVLGAVCALCAGALYMRRRAVRAELEDTERHSGTLAAAMAPFTQRPSLLAVPLAAAALEAVLQLCATACWCRWVSGARMWLAWLLSLWLADCVRLAAQGVLAGATTRGPSTSVDVGALARDVVRGAGAYAQLALLWTPATIIGHVARWVGAPQAAAWAARQTPPGASVCVALGMCRDGAGARRAALHLARAGGAAPASPGPVRACAGRTAVVLRAALLALCAAACARLGVPAPVAVWLCISCSGAASLAATVPALLDALFVQRDVVAFLE